MQPEPIKMEPKGCQTVTKMVPKLIQNDTRISNFPSPVKIEFWDSFWIRFGAALGSTLVPKSVKVPWKSNPKIVPKNDVETIVSFICKSSEIYVKMLQEWNTNVEHIGTCDFGFYKVYNVKIVFWNNHGHLNRSQNQQNSE